MPKQVIIQSSIPITFYVWFEQMLKLNFFIFRDNKICLIIVIDQEEILWRFYMIFHCTLFPIFLLTTFLTFFPSSNQGLYNTGWFKKQFSPCWLEPRKSEYLILSRDTIELANSLSSFWKWTEKNQLVSALSSMGCQGFVICFSCFLGHFQWDVKVSW